MRATQPFRLPLEKQDALARAKRLAWITIGYMLSVVTLMYLVLGSSQAMKAAWLEDLLSLVPPTAFLISTAVAKRPADERHPFGFERAKNIAHLVGSIALFLMGGFLIIDGLMVLISAEHPHIGTATLGGEPFWLGWLMLPTLLYSAAPIVFIGRAKLGLATKLNDKILYADALMNKADWLTGSAAMIGVVGIGMGLWWLDATMAILIGVDVFYDGAKHMIASVQELMDRAPRTVDDNGDDPFPRRLHELLMHQRWIKDVEVRVREEGQVFFADAIVVPKNHDDLVAKIRRTIEEAHQLDWRLHDLVIMPVDSFAQPGIASGKTARPSIELSTAIDALNQR